MSDQRERLPDWTRRNVLKTSGVLGAGALAGCTGDAEFDDFCASGGYEVAEEPDEEDITSDPELEENWNGDSFESKTDPTWGVDMPQDSSSERDSFASARIDGSATDLNSYEEGELVLESEGDINGWVAVESEEQSGWEGPWEVSGTFQVESLSGTVTHAISIRNGANDVIRLPVVDGGQLGESVDDGETYELDFSLKGDGVTNSSIEEDMTFEVGKTYEYFIENEDNKTIYASISEGGTTGDRLGFVRADRPEASDTDEDPMSGQHGIRYSFDPLMNDDDAETVIKHGHLEYNGSEPNRANEIWQFSQSEVTDDGNPRSNIYYGLGQGMAVKHLETQDDATIDNPVDGVTQGTRYRMQVSSSFMSRKGQDGSVSGAEDIDGCELPKENKIRSHEIHITEEAGANHTELMNGTGEGYVGFRPSEGSRLNNIETAAKHTIKFGLSLVPYMGHVIAAGELASDLKEPDDPEGSGGGLHYPQETWRYNQLPESNFCRFDVKVPDNADAVTVKVRDTIYTNGAGSDFGTEATFRFEAEGGGVTKVDETEDEMLVWNPPG